MAMQKLEDQNVRKLIKVGKGTLSVTLPVLLVAKLGWKEKQKVVVKKVRGGLIIRDWKK